jgi:hypothetical protein
MITTHRFRFDFKPQASGTDRVLQFAFQDIFGWKDSQVLRDMYPSCVKL